MVCNIFNASISPNELELKSPFGRSEVIPFSKIEKVYLDAKSSITEFGPNSISIEYYDDSSKLKTSKISFTAEKDDSGKLSEETQKAIEIAKELSKALGNEKSFIFPNEVEKQRILQDEGPRIVKKSILSERSIFSPFIWICVGLFIPPITILSIILLYLWFTNKIKSIWCYKDYLEIRNIFSKVKVQWSDIRLDKAIRNYYNNELDHIQIRLVYKDPSGKDKIFKINANLKSSAQFARELYYRGIIGLEEGYWMLGFLPTEG